MLTNSTNICYFEVLSTAISALDSIKNGELKNIELVLSSPVLENAPHVHL